METIVAQRMTKIEQKQDLILKKLDYIERELRYSGRNDSSTSNKEHSAYTTLAASTNSSNATVAARSSHAPTNESPTDWFVNPTCRLLARSAIAGIMPPRDIQNLSRDELCKIRLFSSSPINFAVNLYRLTHLPIERINLSCSEKCKGSSKSPKTQIDPNLLSTILNYTKLEFNSPIELVQVHKAIDSEGRVLHHSARRCKAAKLCRSCAIPDSVSSSTSTVSEAANYSRNGGTHTNTCTSITGSGYMPLPVDGSTSESHLSTPLASITNRSLPPTRVLQNPFTPIQRPMSKPHEINTLFATGTSSCSFASPPDAMPENDSFLEFSP